MMFQDADDVPRKDQDVNDVPGNEKQEPKKEMCKI